MTRIDSGRTPLSYIQEQIRQLAAPDGKAAGRTDAKKLPNQPADWMELVARSIAAIHPDEAQPRRRAFRIFLKAGLAREFGIQDPDGSEFHRLVDGVYEVMLSDQRISAAIDRAGEWLIRSARQPQRQSKGLP